MTRPIEQFLLWLDSASAGRSVDAARQSAFTAGLHWVHRTCKRGTADWLSILRSGEVEAEPTTPAEQAIGVSRAAYFFLGAAAYPRGLVALIFGPSIDGLPGTCTPIDTGGLLTGRMVDHAGTPIERAESVLRWREIRCDLAEA